MYAYCALAGELVAGIAMPSLPGWLLLLGGVVVVIILAFRHPITAIVF